MELKPTPETVAYSITSAVAATGGAISRTRLFALIGAGEIDARRVGRRTVVLAESLKQYLSRQPGVRGGSANKPQRLAA